MEGDLTGWNALVTGGGSGLGLACAAALRSDGATVTIVGRTPARLTEAAGHLQRLPGGGEVRWVVADVTDEAAVAAAAARADEGGGLRLVVASAGTGWLGPLATIPAEAWRHVIDVNLTGNFLTLKHAAPLMRRAGGGSYVAISSVSGRLPTACLTPYTTAKAGLDMLVRSAADELGAWGIRVNSVAPGLVATDLTESLADDDAVRAEHLDNTPLGRLGRADDVAAAVRFLCGPASSWVTGVTLAVDGGHHLRRAARFDAYVRAEHGDDWLPPR